MKLGSQTRIHLMLLWIIGFVVYGQSLLNGFIIGDDYDQILNNPLVHSVQNILLIFQGSTYYQVANQSAFGLFYRPMMLSVYTFLYAIFGADPLYFHLLQLGIHCVNACLVYLLVRKLLPHLQQFWVLMMGLIFLVHPINSETVLHIANLQEVLFLFFGLLSCLWFLKSKSAGFLYLLGSGILLLLAFLSKETAILFVPILLYIQLIEIKERSLIRVPTIIIPTIVYVLIRIILVDVSYELPSISLIAQVDSMTRLANVPAVVWHYLYTYFWPAKLSIYQFWLHLDPGVVDIVMPLVGIGVVVFGLVLALKKLQISLRSIGIWMLWILAGIGLHSQILPLYITVAERWFYFSSVGLTILAVLIISKLSFNKIPPRQIKYLVIVIVVTLGIRTHMRTYAWSDSLTLLHTDNNTFSQDYYLKNVLGSYYIETKDYQTAQPYVQASVDEFEYLGNVNNLAIIKMNQGKFGEAEKLFIKSMRMQTSYQTTVNYVNFLVYATQDYDAVLEQVPVYLGAYPYSFDLWIALAQAEYSRGSIVEAQHALAEAKSINPNSQILKRIENIVANQEPLDPEKILGPNN